MEWIQRYSVFKLEIKSEISLHNLNNRTSKNIYSYYRYNTTLPKKELAMKWQLPLIESIMF